MDGAVIPRGYPVLDKTKWRQKIVIKCPLLEEKI